VRVRGFAELVYRDSARLVFARACEACAVDVALDHPEAWVVDDRRISFALDLDLSEAELAAHEALLLDLAAEAASGEVELLPQGGKRFFALAGQLSSGTPVRGSGPLEIVTEAGTPTIPVSSRRRG
jgi:hypothetical protein